MAIGFAILDAINFTADQNSYSTTGGVTPAANALVLGIGTVNRTPPLDPVVTGYGLTWEQIAAVSFQTIGTPSQRLSLFRAMGTPVAGNLTFDYGANTCLGASLAVCQFTGVDTSGSNGSGAVVQAATNAANATANPNVTLAALDASALNAVFACFGKSTNPFSGVAEGGWTEDLDTGHGIPASGFYLCHRLLTTDNTVVVTSASGDWGGIAIEIKVEPPPPTGGASVPGIARGLRRLRH